MGGSFTFPSAHPHTGTHAARLHQTEEEEAPSGITPPEAQENSLPILVDTAFRCHPGVTSSGWMGLHKPETNFEPEARKYSLEEVNKMPGMRVIDWQGVPSLLVDAEHYIFGVLGGQPRNSRWGPDVVEPATKLMEEVAENMYDRVFSGVYYGRPLISGGQEFPVMFFHNVLKTIVLAGLLAQKPFRRIAGFANTLFQCYAPDLHAYYGDTMNKLYEWNPALLRNFPCKVSIFAATTFNFCPRIVTFPHLDFANLAWGWCAITVLSDFDPNCGSHLILWDLKLIIRFPPGSTILIPSALIQHSNTSIQAHENASHSRSTHLQESSASSTMASKATSWLMIWGPQWPSEQHIWRQGRRVEWRV
ncbi:hypothetical protein B0H14DRAFT_3425604 [Mycena olivaceomarginata]|nr:hypothetical protein B0H14DRAFT_3425604 [Mycena olivaceomarginata]